MSYQISQNLSLNIYNRWLLAKNSNIFTSIKWEKFRLGSTKLIFHFLFRLSYIGVINSNIVWSFRPVSNKFGCGLRRNLLVCGMKNNLPLASRHLLMMWYLNLHTVTFIGITTDGSWLPNFERTHEYPASLNTSFREESCLLNIFIATSCFVFLCFDRKTSP